LAKRSSNPSGLVEKGRFFFHAIANLSNFHAVCWKRGAGSRERGAGKHKGKGVRRQESGVRRQESGDRRPEISQGQRDKGTEGKRVFDHGSRRWRDGWEAIFDGIDRILGNF